ncbi:MAG: plasmid mobilization protein [Candidatus Acidiferrales bacterium]
MTADQLRSRTVGCKMTEAEYERLNTNAEERGVTLGEWCREVLLQHTNAMKPVAVEEVLLAEVIALRTVLLNAFYKLAQGETLTADEMQRLIERADHDKFRKAQERLKAGGE